MINIPISENLLSLFSTWSEHFKTKLTDEGILGLIQEYKNLIYNIQTKSCPHKNNGERNYGEDYQNCCGISYEYYNDINVRTALQMIIEYLPTKLSQSLIDTIFVEDNLLIKLIIENNKISREDILLEINWWSKFLPSGVVE